MFCKKFSLPAHSFLAFGVFQFQISLFGFFFSPCLILRTQVANVRTQVAYEEFNSSILGIRPATLKNHSCEDKKNPQCLHVGTAEIMGCFSVVQLLNFSFFSTCCSAYWRVMVSVFSCTEGALNCASIMMLSMMERRPRAPSLYSMALSTM